ncbi:hypothetical protein [Parvularcula sp. IMCC14364]|uniref:hypothetical protein n=1 Tax=Parvularcula sp. IMCC14364 TaxID=3067902 RepID=UPI002740D693|nr:hypothetical protein [Parvularcula sp. IMCC14364]
MIEHLKTIISEREEILKSNSIEIDFDEGDGADEWYEKANVPWMKCELAFLDEKMASITWWETGYSSFNIATVENNEVKTPYDEFSDITSVEEMKSAVDEFIKKFLEA